MNKVQLKEIVKTTLFPVLQSKITENEENNKVLIELFEKRIENIVNYCYEYLIKNTNITKEYITDLHKFLFNKGDIIYSTQYNGTYIKNNPGEWRKQEFINKSELVNTSRISDIESDIEHLLFSYNNIPTIRRTDVVALYFRLIQIHPFEDANGRIAALVSNIECLRHNLKLLNMLDIRFKNRTFLLHLTGYYDNSNGNDNLLLSILEKIDHFHSQVSHEYRENYFTKENTFEWNSKTLFSKFYDGIQIDEVGLYSVKPEVLAIETAQTIKGETILDAFGGVGGSAIGFALTGKKVICVELDETRLNMAKNNAMVYGMSDQITFIHGDILKILPGLDFDGIYFDPPWGGIDYINKKSFGFSDFSPDGNILLDIAFKKTQNIVFSLPINFDIQEIIKLGIDFYLQKNILDGKHIFSTVYFGYNINDK
ncbi:Fic family protein [Candidatus Gracilibacteria bacterium]|nr:Fic family protein [Candidatus Gracilibacteria bacterium]